MELMGNEDASGALEVSRYRISEQRLTNMRVDGRQRVIEEIDLSLPCNV